MSAFSYEHIEIFVKKRVVQDLGKRASSVDQALKVHGLKEPAGFINKPAEIFLNYIPGVIQYILCSFIFSWSSQVNN